MTPVNIWFWGIICALPISSHWHHIGPATDSDIRHTVSTYSMNQSRSTSSRCSKLVLQWKLEGGNDNESRTLLVLHIIVHHKYLNLSHPMTRSFIFYSELTCVIHNKLQRWCDTVLFHCSVFTSGYSGWLTINWLQNLVARPLSCWAFRISRCLSFCFSAFFRAPVFFLGIFWV